LYFVPLLEAHIYFHSSSLAAYLSMGLFKRGSGDVEADGSHAAKANTYNFLVVFFAALGSFTYGYNSSIIGSVFGLPAFWEYFDLSLNGPNAQRGNDMIGGKSSEDRSHGRCSTSDNNVQLPMACSRVEV
jgi:hypothetical protein